MFAFGWKKIRFLIIVIGISCLGISWVFADNSSTKGDLVVSVKIGDVHGGVYTYDLDTNPTQFGLKINFDGSSSFSEEETYIPKIGFKKFEDLAPADIQVSLSCDFANSPSETNCGWLLDWSDEKSKKRLLTQNISIEKGKTAFVDFVVIPNQDTTNGHHSIKITSREEWQNASALVTNVGRMARQSNIMLDWVLKLHDTGFHNQAINTLFKKMTNIVNGFLIIALILIAGAWNFTMFISTQQLRKLLLIFAIFSIIVNFTLPINRLIIDTAESVQNSFLTKSDGEKLDADDLFAVNIDEENWVGRVTDSWTWIGLTENEWGEVHGSLIFSDGMPAKVTADELEALGLSDAQKDVIFDLSVTPNTFKPYDITSLLEHSGITDDAIKQKVLDLYYKNCFEQVPKTDENGDPINYITSKGNTADNPEAGLKPEDCVGENECADLQGIKTNCALVPKPWKCNVGDRINVWACDSRKGSQGWITGLLECVILEE